MEISRHWRLRKQRYNIIGEKEKLGDGRTRYRLNNGPWVEASDNGHYKGENPTELPTHQVSDSPGNNDRERLPTRGSVEIYAASD